MEELEKEFAKTLFCEEDIEYVRNQLFENNGVLYEQDCSRKLQRKIIKLQEKINNLHSTEVNILLREYENLMIENIEQQNCLAYYLGLRKGIEFHSNIE